MRNKFHEVSGSQFHNKEIHIQCVISGKSLSPYCIPKKLKITTDTGSEKIYTIDATNEDILKLIDMNSLRLGSVLKNILRIDKFKYEILEVQNVERLFILPPTGKERNKLGTTHVAYFIGYGLEINTLYDMHGYTTVDPTNQTTTHVFTSATKIKSDIETFSLTNKMLSNMHEFCVENATSNKIFERLNKLYEFYAHNITKIYDRFDLHFAMDMAFRSVISFRFANEYVHKGWTDVMVIGDTRCGKGYVAEKLMNYFGVGEVVSGDNISLAGLVGGLQQFNKHWVVTWGKIPLNDCGLLVIDEASEIKDNEWSRLSRIRSEGVAEITKIHSQITNARTRLIFLANPPQKTISNYSYGIQSITDIIKSPEDIARFDYVLVVAHSEVDMSSINKQRSLVGSMHPASLEQDLLLWTWSRKPSDILFSDDAVKLIYKLSIELAKTYVFQIPLIQGENVRIKLAKMAIAFASRVFSTKKNGKILYIDKVHVECAFKFFHLIYSKECSGYLAFSKLQKHVDIQSETDLQKVETYFNAYRNKIELYKYLLISNDVSVNTMSEYLNQPPEIAREILSMLLQKNCIVKVGTKYVKSPTFLKWIKKSL